MVFDFDPDDAYEEDMADDPSNDVEEDAAEDFSDEADIESDETDDFGTDDGVGLADAAMGAAIFGMAEEHGEEEAKRRHTEDVLGKNSKEFERPEGAVSLKARKKESKLPKFEQWVRDVITGKKTLDDEL
jgi:hypothetical protein